MRSPQRSSPPPSQQARPLGWGQAQVLAQAPADVASKEAACLLAEGEAGASVNSLHVQLGI
jgi:hypothetical protein